MADFVRFELQDGSEVFFEASEGDLVSLRGGEPDVAEGGVLRDRLGVVTRAAQEVSEGLRERLAADQVELEFGVSVSAEVNWWFFSRTQGEGSIKVRLRWDRGGSGASVSG